MTTSPLVKTAQTVISNPIKKRNPTIEDFKFRDGLPSAEELPDSDGKAVDSELQELIPGLLKAILIDLWDDRSNWLFSIDMGFYYHPDQPVIAPDGLLSLGVEDIEDECLRSSYVLWDEQVIPLFALEIVSKTPGKEQTKKFEIYRSIGILYYLVYAPLRKRKTKFQLYKLIDGDYVLQSEGQQPYWMPEIGLAIGAERRIYQRSQREWLYWYDQNSLRYQTPTERAKAASQRAQAESQRAEVESERAQAESERANLAIAAQTAVERENIVLRQRLRDLGIDPDA
ncbi:MAG: Uma2 family endonuclease [Chamaesiphon sp.]|nr:Uma2 family endonuclease [Chamaesiphon sp.]